MSTIKTDEKLIDKFLTRGVANIYPSKKALRLKLLSGDKIRAYQGFDPTGPYLHVGHAMGIRAMKILQQLGHEVIFLIGDFTARVGDPDKAKARDSLTIEQVQKNMKGWKEQAAQLIDFEGNNPVQFKHNYDWLSKLKLEELLELMSKATVQQMAERDLFSKRMKAGDPIQLHEFIYPLMQAYDGIEMNVDLEMGGTDQTFNMIMGRHLSKIYLNKEKFVRTNELMDAPDTLTMSKTKGNGINLSASANDMYGKAMSYPDDLITKGLRLLTDVALEDIWDIEKQIESGKNPMDFKKLMAFEITKTIKGKSQAEDAQKNFVKITQHREIPQELKEISTGSKTVLETAMLISEESLSQTTRVIKQGGFSVNGEKITNPNQKLENNRGDIIKVGKRNYGKIA